VGKVKKIFIASSFTRFEAINSEIYNRLSKSFNVFLSGNLDFTGLDMKSIAEICYQNIDDSDYIVAIAPFGLSVSSELGYTIALNKNGHSKKIILFNHIFDEKLNNEDMFMPYIDFVSSNIDEILNFIKNK